MGKVYAQIYSLIRMQREGTLAALKEISDIGYDGVELLSTFTEGKSVAEFKAYLSEWNLDAISSASYMTEQDLAFGQELGIRYCTYGRVPIGTTREQVLAATESLNENGKLVARHGIRMIVHNHANEFMRPEGETDGPRIYDLLLQHTDPNLVSFEFDVGWGQYAGIDCPAYIRQYPGRFPLIHVKECNRIARNEEELEHFPPKIMALAKKLDPDFAKPGRPPSFPAEAANLMYHSRDWNVALGEGLLDWKTLAEAAEAQGIEAYISEREFYHITGNPEGNAGTAARLDYRYMRGVFR